MQTIKLIDVCEFVRNGANIKQLSNETRGIPITRIETLANDRFNRDRLGYANITDDSFSDYYLKRGDVLLSHINGAKFIGRSVIYEPKEGETIIHGMNLLCLRFKSNYNPKFFCYYAKSKAAKNYFDKHIKKAVNQASITATDIKNMPIPDINIDEQNKIVAVLDLLYSRIASIETEESLFNELVKARFFEMFGECSNKKQLSEVTTRISDGSHNPPKGIEKSDYMMLSSQNIFDELDLSDVRYLSKEDFERENKRTDIKENDVLLTIVGTIGRTHVVKADEKYVFQRSVAVIKPIHDVINGIYLSACLHTNDVIDQFESNGHGSSQKGIYLQDLKKVLIPVPKINLQNEFADFVNLINDSKLELKKHNKVITELINKTMSDYFFEYDED